jgi:hypothetical protein
VHKSTQCQYLKKRTNHSDLIDTDVKMEDLLDLVDYLAVYDAEVGLDKLLSDVKSSLDAQMTEL